MNTLMINGCTVAYFKQTNRKHLITRKKNRNEQKIHVYM